ncbi:MAG: hypothetical protein PG977_001125 [Bartonella clarridgeiae]|nr:MAG: hypothetical protein PG977_001125 [Bartonella clarridgeiae]
MKVVLSLGIGVLVGSDIWLLLRPGTFQVILGFSLISYSINFLSFSMSRFLINTGSYC